MPEDTAIWLKRARFHARAGDQLLAYDVAIRGLDEYPEDIALKYTAVLALARSGAAAMAQQRFTELGLGSEPRDRLSLSLHIDIASLEARIAKDLALAASPEMRPGLLGEAAGRYRKVFEETRDYYPGINAATLLLLGGRPGAAKRLAASVAAICRRQIAQRSEDSYYLWATLAEASLIARDRSAAAEALAEARASSDATPDAVATTRKQLRLVCAATAMPPSLLEGLRPVSIVYFTGHLIGARLSEAEAQALAPRIDAILARHRVAVGFGSLASGADIVIAETLLDRGADIELVFPFRLEEFREVSVRPAGESWVQRFDRCLAAARSQTFATDDAYLGDEYLIRYSSGLAIGLALQRAAMLDTEARLVGIWDGGGMVEDRHAVGTAANVSLWHSLGHPADVLTPAGVPIDAALAPAPGSAQGAAGRRVLRALLFGDIKGFSKLTEPQLPVFADKILGTVAETLARYGAAINHSNTWGDGLYVVVDDAETAADCALELQRVISTLPFDDIGLPDTLGLRLGGHFGPVFPVYDPVIKQLVYMGTHVSRTARIEPVTPEGAVYVTDAFAAAVAVTRQPRFICDYVGVVPAAKNYGSMRMFRLSRRQSQTA
jgi:class 3 adenylate cyclase